ncbi:MAG: type I restriction enzyme HsdR N-terminal domain-containing protein [Flavobacteriales bacterium]|nr:type I restriction enzyme HsdR N-terminal domain-containing protein [Flavobacteriales bacterium]
MKDFDFEKTTTEVFKEGDLLWIYDTLRKKKIRYTPEEDVRQKIVKYLLSKGISAGLIAIERALKINRMLKRFDLVVFNTSGKPHLVIECKAPTVKLTQDSVQQLATYNISLKARYMMVSNGIHHICCEVDHENKNVTFIEDLPI